MAEKILTTPISAKDLEDIRIGDILWLDGLITTCRDVAHRRLIDDDRPLPISLSGGAIFHAGPIVRPVSRPQNDPSPTYQIVSIGPTTSMRMEKFEKEFIRQTGVRLIVGKGGMGTGNYERLPEIQGHSLRFSCRMCRRCCYFRGKN